MKNGLKLGIAVMFLMLSCKDATQERVIAEKDVEGVWLMTVSVGGQTTILHADYWEDVFSPLQLDNGENREPFHFRLQGDTIFMNSRLRIFPVDSTSLVPFLQVLELDSLRMRVKVLGKHTDTLNFIRPSALVAKNDVLKEFGVSTSGCYGRCSSARFRIREDSTFYDGYSFVPNEGHYQGKTDPALWEDCSVLFSRPDMAKEDTTIINEMIDDQNVYYYFITEKDTLQFCCEKSPSQPELTAMIRLAGCYVVKSKTERPADRKSYPWMRSATPVH